MGPESRWDGNPDTLTWEVEDLTRILTTKLKENFFSKYSMYIKKYKARNSLLNLKIALVRFGLQD